MNIIPVPQHAFFQEYLKDLSTEEHRINSLGLSEESCRETPKTSPSSIKISEFIKKIDLKLLVVKKKVCPFVSFMNKIENTVKRSFHKVGNFFTDSYNSLTGKKITVKKKGDKKFSKSKDLNKGTPIDGGLPADCLAKTTYNIKAPIIEKKVTCPYLAVVKFSKRIWNAVKDIFQTAIKFCKDSYHYVVGKKKIAHKTKQPTEKQERLERRIESETLRDRREDSIEALKEMRVPAVKMIDPIVEFVRVPDDIDVDYPSEFSFKTTEDLLNIAINRILMGDTIYFSQHASEETPFELTHFDHVRSALENLGFFLVRKYKKNTNASDSTNKLMGIYLSLNYDKLTPQKLAEVAATQIANGKTQYFGNSYTNMKPQCSLEILDEVKKILMANEYLLVEEIEKNKDDVRAGAWLSAHKSTAPQMVEPCSVETPSLSYQDEVSLSSLEEVTLPEKKSMEPVDEIYKIPEDLATSCSHEAQNVEEISTIASNKILLGETVRFSALSSSNGYLPISMFNAVHSFLTKQDLPLNRMNKTFTYAERDLDEIICIDLSLDYGKLPEKKLIEVAATQIAYGKKLFFTGGDQEGESPFRLKNLDKVKNILSFNGYVIEEKKLIVEVDPSEAYVESVWLSAKKA